MFNSLIYFIYKYLKVLILFPHPTAIGNCAEDIFEALRVAKLHHRKILLILPIKIRFKIIPFKTIDPKTFDLDSKLFIVRPLSLVLLPTRILIWTISFPFIVMWLLLDWMNIAVPKWGLYPYAGQKIVFNKFDTKSFNTPTFEACLNEWKVRSKIKNLDIKLRDSNQVLISNFRNAAGLLESEWFACLHVRTSDFYGDTEENLYRNASIENYSKLVEKIFERGGKVIRIGDKNMPKIADIKLFNDYEVFDLAHSEYNKGIVNSWVIANCAFYVGMQSGPFDLARLFQKPILLTNMYTPFFGTDNEHFSRGIYKNFIDLTKRVRLSTLEIIKENNYNGDYSPRNITFYENTEDELALFLDESISINGSLTKRDLTDDYISKHNELMIELIRIRETNGHSLRWMLRSLF